LTKVIGGLALTVPIYLFLYWLGRLTGYTAVTAGAAFPLAVSLIGWLELILGVGFADLAVRFDRGGGLSKLGIALLVLSLIGLYAGIAIWIYGRYS
jgi:hypothetical protein